MNLLLRRSFVLSLTSVLILAATASADLLVGLDFDPLTGGTGVWGPSPYAPASTASGINAVGLTRGSGMLTPATASVVSDAWGGADFTTGNLIAAITAGDFLTFSLTPAATMSLSSIDPYNVRISAGGGPNTPPTTGQWQYDAGSGFTNIGSAITWGTNTGAAGNPQSAISLTGIPALQNVPSGNTVTFRLVNWGGGSSGVGQWYLNNPNPATPDIDFSISGSITAVPEPVAFLFGGIACVGLGLGVFGKRVLAKLRG